VTDRPAEADNRKNERIGQPEERREQISGRLKAANSRKNGGSR